MSAGKNRVCIGIPCYQNAPAETLEDYMRFAYWLGRRATEYQFFLAIKPKSEQFRARNAIVTAALQMDCDYLLMLDDDQVIDWRGSNEPTDAYGFIVKLLDHLKSDEKLGVVGALYYHRGGDCLPVIMKEGKDGGYYYMRDDEVEGKLQIVAVTGGGCMLLRMDAVLKLPQPIFAPEFQYGTDIQVAQKMRDAGYRVACDTSLVLGHVKTTREIVTPQNRVRISAESNSGGDRDESQISPAWKSYTAYCQYQSDALEFAGVPSLDNAIEMAREYNDRLAEFPSPLADGTHDPEVLKNYYRSRGRDQLMRQVFFHGSTSGLNNDSVVLSILRPGKSLYGLEFGCGSSPVGGEFAIQGHSMDFVDIPGTYAYEFLKWRMEKRGCSARVHFDEARGPYDFILLLDVLEHLPDPAAKVRELSALLKPDGLIITNYFYLAEDKSNLEHISMDRESVKEALVGSGVYPINNVIWIKRNLAVPLKESAA